MMPLCVIPYTVHEVFVTFIAATYIGLDQKLAKPYDFFLIFYSISRQDLQNSSNFIQFEILCPTESIDG